METTTTFYRNFIRYCAQKGKSPSAVAEEVGLSRTAPNGWKKGKQPSDITLNRLALYFEIPVSDLTQEKDADCIEYTKYIIDPKTKELMSIWESNTPEGRDAILAIAKAYIMGRREGNANP